MLLKRQIYFATSLFFSFKNNNFHLFSTYIFKNTLKMNFHVPYQIVIFQKILENSKLGFSCAS
jgi:hypothetical protein